MSISVTACFEAVRWEVDVFVGDSIDDAEKRIGDALCLSEGSYTVWGGGTCSVGSLGLIDGDDVVVKMSEKSGAIEVLKQKGVGNGVDDLIRAVKGGNDEIAVLLLQAGVDAGPLLRNPRIVAQQVVSRGNTQGLLILLTKIGIAAPSSLLGTAVENGRVEAAKMLLDHGCNPNALAPTGFSPTHAVCKHPRHAPFLSVFLSSPADPTIPSKFRHYTGVHLSAAYSSQESIRTLIAFNSQFLSLRTEGTAFTPLHVSAAHGNLGTTKALLELGAAPRATDATRLGPLYYAIRGMHRKCAEILEVETTEFADRKTRGYIVQKRCVRWRRKPR